MDILLPKYPQASSEDWIMFELILPNGYRHIATVARDAADGSTMTGDIYDLGQNADGLFRLFRRLTGEMENSHDIRGEALSPDDLMGFGLTRDQCKWELGDEYEGEYSSLNRTMLIN